MLEKGVDKCGWLSPSEKRKAGADSGALRSLSLNVEVLSDLSWGAAFSSAPSLRHGRGNVERLRVLVRLFRTRVIMSYFMMVRSTLSKQGTFFWRSAASLSGSGVYPTNTCLFSGSAEIIMLFREATEDSSIIDIITSKFHDCRRNEGFYHVCPIIFPFVWCTINNSITFLTSDLPFATFFEGLLELNINGSCTYIFTHCFSRLFFGQSKHTKWKSGRERQPL